MTMMIETLSKLAKQVILALVGKVTRDELFACLNSDLFDKIIPYKDDDLIHGKIADALWQLYQDIQKDEISFAVALNAAFVPLQQYEVIMREQPIIILSLKLRKIILSGVITYKDAISLYTIPWNKVKHLLPTNVANAMIDFKMSLDSYIRDADIGFATKSHDEQLFQETRETSDQLEQYLIEKEKVKFLE